MSHTSTEALRTTNAGLQIGSKLARSACGTKRSARAAARCEIAGVGKKFPLSAEKLSPVLSLLFVADYATALDTCFGLLKFGGAGHTAIFHPGPKIGSRGTWTVGPDFPNGDNTGDSWAVLLPSGNVLVAGNSGRFYEFDGTNLKFTLSGYGALLTLPTGQVLVSGNQVQLYNPTGTYLPSWAPTISASPGTITRGSTYSISGTQFNGLSQAASFGDEFETSTNYPLVRITNQTSHHVFYARTHDHSSMGVATGTAIVSTNFDVPAGAETGVSSLEVVANGIPSAAVTVTVN